MNPKQLVGCILREEQDLLYTHNQVKTILEYLQNVKREPNFFLFLSDDNIGHRSIITKT